jgi:hypothetical protein
MSSETLERTRCAHGLDRYACAWCESERETVGHAHTRAAVRLAASVRASLARAERERDTMRGYALMSAATVETVNRETERLARRYGCDESALHAVTIDRVARWFARNETARDASTERVRATVRLIGDRVARKLSTGRGTMPRLSHARHAPECERGECVAWCAVVKVAAYLAAQSVAVGRAPVAAIDAATWERMSESERGERIARMSETACESVRVLSESERDSLADALTFERAPGAPDWPRWLDAFGDTAPNVGDAHPYATRAPGRPERDAPTMRAASLSESVRMVAPERDAATYLAALDAVSETGRGRFVIDWDAVAAAIGDRAHRTTYRRRVERVARTLAAIDRDALPIPNREHESERMRGDTVRVDAVPRHRCDRTCDHYGAVCVSLALLAPRRVVSREPDIGDHARLMRRERERGYRAGCEGTAAHVRTLAPIRDAVPRACACIGDDHASECETRRARRDRIARVERVADRLTYRPMLPR